MSSSVKLLLVRAYVCSLRNHRYSLARAHKQTHTSTDFVVSCSSRPSGPDSDPSVPNVGLYFDVLEDDVAICTPQQAKRFRWKRGLHNNKKNSRTEKGSKSSSIFDLIECFVMYRPCESEAFDLCTSILKHRLVVLQTQQNACHSLLNHRSTLDLRLEELLNLIRCQIERWQRWSWPINEGREHVDEATCVPAVDGYYYQDTAGMKLAFPTRETTKIWESFVGQACSDPERPPSKVLFSFLPARFVLAVMLQV
jgi:hypothetical protein